MKTLGFIGGGRITRILLKGFYNAGIRFRKIAVSETNPAVAAQLLKDFPEIHVSETDPSEAAGCDLLFISLHPPVFMQTLAQLKGLIGKNASVVSLAPKITISKMQSELHGVRNIARMNPNAGTYVNRGFNPVCFSGDFEVESKEKILELFGKLGKVPVVPEEHIEAYAVVSAMGHTYFWFQLQEVRELAKEFGLSEKETAECITAMMWGTTETLFSSGLPFEKVIDLVPVKPLAEHEPVIKEVLRSSLNGIYNKIKP